MGLIAISTTTSAHEKEHRPKRLFEGTEELAAHDAYVNYCATCHGETGRGASASNDFGSPEAVARLTRQAMIAETLHGHTGVANVNYKREIGEKQIPAIVDYIRDTLMLPAPVSDASKGRAIYAHTCSVCHGERGNAVSRARNSLNPPPFDFTSERAAELTRQRMIRSVSYGVQGTAMMPFTTQLSRDEITAVVDYIRTNFLKADATDKKVAKHGSSTSGHAHHAGGDTDPEAGFAGNLAGNYGAGKSFYDNNCAECHGLTGEGDGPRAYFMRKKPVDLTSPKARAELNRPHLFEAIASGILATEMSAWSKVLDRQQIADVAEYVFQAFIRQSDEHSSDAGTAAPDWRPQAHGHDVKKKP